MNATNDLGYPVSDYDNHYYEALDAFTRHLDPKYGRRIIQWAEIDGRKYHVIAGKVSHAVVNPTFDPVVKAGAMAEYFRGNPNRRPHADFMREREPIPAHYRDRDARLRMMDEQGLDKIWLFPTLGMLYEELVKHDPEGVGIMFRAFNRWLEEDWGYDYQGRIFAAPYVSLADVDFAIETLERALSLGARTICMRPAAPTTRDGRVTPADRRFDPFWARVNEAGITVAVHAGDTGHSLNGYGNDGFTTEGADSRRNIGLLVMERSICDFLASVMLDELFVRFPNIRMVSVENGAEFLPDLFRKLRSTHRRIPGFFTEDPIESFRQHVWINPFWEDDPYEIAELVGTDHVVFGSDWPHIEGLPNPRDYAVEIKELDVESQRLIMHDNAEALSQLRPV